jgi:hypothetical protein
MLSHWLNFYVFNNHFMYKTSCFSLYQKSINKSSSLSDANGADRQSSWYWSKHDVSPGCFTEGIIGGFNFLARTSSHLVDENIGCSFTSREPLRPAPRRLSGFWISNFLINAFVTSSIVRGHTIRPAKTRLGISLSFWFGLNGVANKNKNLYWKINFDIFYTST